MISLKGLIAVIAIFYSALGINAELISTSWDHDFPNSDVVLDLTHSLQDTKLLYAVCDKSEIHTEKKCKVILRSLTEQSCDVVLKADENIGTAKRISLFGSNKVILVWSAKDKQDTDYFIKVTTIDLSNCQSTEASIAVDQKDQLNNVVRDTEIITYENTFAIVFKNTKSCGDKLCKLVFNSLGKRIAEPIAWLPSKQGAFLIEPVARNSEAKGHFAVNINDNLDFTLVKPDGPKLLKSYSTARYSGHGGHSFIYSTANDIIGFCLLANATATCTQFDQEGKQKLETTVKFSSVNILIGALYNLPSGGFLLADRRAGGDFTVFKVNADGKQFGSYKLSEFKCKNLWQLGRARFFVNDSKDNCIATVCDSEEKIQRLEYDAACFPDKDYTK